MEISRDAFIDDDSDEEQEYERLAPYDCGFDEIAQEWNGLGREIFSEYDDPESVIGLNSAAQMAGEEMEMGDDNFEDFYLPLSAILSDKVLEQIIEDNLPKCPPFVRKLKIDRIRQIDERIYQLYLEHYQAVQDEEIIIKRLSTRPFAAHLTRRVEMIQLWKSQIERQVSLLDSDRQRLMKCIND